MGWALFFICAVALVCLAVLNYREVTRIARFLEKRDAQSNARLSVGVAGRHYKRLVRAINFQLDESSEEKRAFVATQREFQNDLASLSHDIRTPLAGAKGYLQLAEEEVDLSRRSHYSDMAIERLDAMQALLDQLFAYTRATDPDMELDLHPVCAISALESVLAASFPDFEQRKWQPEVVINDSSLMVMADSNALERVFENIVRNALAHGSGAPRIVQRASVITFINPVNNSASIDEDKLFNRFYRADSSRAATSAGLGLAVVASLCEAMNIKPVAEVKDNTFKISLHF